MQTEALQDAIRRGPQMGDALTKILLNRKTPTDRALVIEDNLDLARSAARSMKKRLSHLPYDDLFNEAVRALHRLTKRYNTNIGQWRGYAGAHIKNATLDCVGRADKRPSITPRSNEDLAVFPVDIFEQADRERQLELGIALRCFVNRLDKKLSEIIRLKFGLDRREMSVSDIAQRMDLSRQQVHNLVNTALQKIRDMGAMEKLREYLSY